MVEENTAASFGLASESQQLADLIGHFKFDGMAPTARQPMPVGWKLPPIRAA